MLSLILTGVSLRKRTPSPYPRPDGTPRCGGGAEIENFSTFGQTLKKCCEKGHIERWLNEHTGTRDKLILSLGGNDCDYNWAAISENPKAEHQPNTPLPEFISSCRKMFFIRSPMPSPYWGMYRAAPGSSLLIRSSESGPEAR